MDTPARSETAHSIVRLEENPFAELLGAAALNKIRRKNIVNFGEAGFRVGYAKGQWILVPEDVKEFYSLSPENRRSLTIFEAIDATGGEPPPPLMVIQGKHLMVDWFSPEMDPDILIVTSEKGFTNNEIAVIWLKHFIQHSNAGPRVE